MTGWLGDHLDLRWHPGETGGSQHQVLVISHRREVAVTANGKPLLWSLDTARATGQSPTLVGTLDQRTYYAIALDEAPEGAQFEPLRPVLIGLQSEEFLPLSAAMQRLDFVREHQFCGQCGQPTVASATDRGLTCTQCSLSVYPRISPCVIVLITRGDEVLLSRSPRFVEGMYSTLAGFVEAGESAEHACHREIFEEVGVAIHNLRYQGSQSWPFKHSLMLGYRAEWLSGDIAVDGEEIVDAQWFSINSLPKLPPNASISRGMIEAYRQERRLD